MISSSPGVKHVRPNKHDNTAVISQAILTQAVMRVDGLGINERIALSDEIFLQQPNLLASVLVLQRMGASYPQIDVVLNLLLVTYQAMKISMQ